MFCQHSIFLKIIYADKRTAQFRVIGTGLK